MTNCPDNNVNQPVYRSPAGNFVGEKIDGVIKIRNIRYATSQRYQLPEAFIYDKDEVAILPEKTPVCPQNISPLIDRMIEKTNVEDYEVTESNQFLTITKPLEANDNIPVLVWIHGGSYEIGCGSLPTSDPSLWVKEQNIIVVSLSFRLGIFGFLGGYDDRIANLGFYDIVEGLKWVKNNIAAFGGDPNRITIIGQSSGGDAVAHLLALEESKKLFKRAIIHSAPLGLRNNRFKMAHFYSDKTKGIKYDEDGLKMVEFQQKVAPKISKFGISALMPFGLQYDFAPFFSAKNVDENWMKNAKDFDILVGINEDETALYLKTSGKLAENQQNRWVSRLLNKAVEFSTQKIYGVPAVKFAKNMAASGAKVYHFVIKSRNANNRIGAVHCIDLPLLFGNQKAWQNAELLKDIPWEYVFEKGKEIRKIWADFVRDGNPSTENLPDILSLNKV